MLAFLLGSCMGSRFATDSSPDIVRLPPKTEIVYRDPLPPEQVSIFPAACQAAVALADSMARAAEKLYASGEEQLTIISDGRLTLAAKKNMSEIEERQRRLHGKTIGHLYDLEESFARYETAMKECEKANE
jgi:hypothetical protein